ncbi:CPBP family intramembrane glutamic endopeptidase [Ohtaekwangia koreensis]|uniref:CAAX protease self-immunity n=1 Tax=Ohtaekwangia koreensis TaxID=688867 RepID=A0A1T5K969_9BACT|nr:CPBP family intramembrane glutamic endopeptidase [Ohtaekwangia koreensis]SKC60233.1 CAAX protease self-immunity [Ohtaekwangia koreensis]
MKKIWKHLVSHFNIDFQWAHYLFTALFLAACLYINYTVDFEDSILDNLSGMYKCGAYFIFFAVAYYTVLLSATVFKKERAFWKSRAFHIKSLLVLFVLAFDKSIPFLKPLINSFVEPQLYVWVYKVSVNVISLFTIILPLLLYYYIYERKEKHVYGLNAQHFDTRPYFSMLMIMLPLILAASFLPSFIKQYPMYRGAGAAQYLDIPEWITVSSYELAYALDFVSVEFLFRGFLVIGLLQFTGRNSVLAMASAYCFLHFGKPAGEAISSIFGGYILGVIAYETKSIWGGIIVHVGIAWMMEGIAYLQKIFHYLFE